MHAFDQSDGQTQFAAQFALAGGHLAVVGLVVQAGEMQQPMQQEDADLIAQRVPEGRGLTGGGIERDRQIAGVVVRILGGGKAQNIGGLVLAAKGLVQAAQRGIVGQQDIDVAVQADCLAGTVEEARQAGLRERPESSGWSMVIISAASRLARRYRRGRS